MPAPGVEVAPQRVREAMEHVLEAGAHEAPTFSRHDFHEAPHTSLGQLNDVRWSFHFHDPNDALGWALAAQVQLSR